MLSFLLSSNMFLHTKIWSQSEGGVKMIIITPSTLKCTLRLCSGLYCAVSKVRRINHRYWNICYQWFHLKNRLLCLIKKCLDFIK